MFASRRPAAKLEMRASCPAAEAPRPAAPLSKLPQFANSPGLYPGGLHPGRAELAHVANYKGAAFQIQEFLKTWVRPQEAGLRILNHYSDIVSQTGSNYLQREQKRPVADI